MRMHNPPYPGEIIREFCIETLNLTVTDAAKALGVTRKTFSNLLRWAVRNRSKMVLRLSKVFGRSPEGWLKLQLLYNLWQTHQNVDLKNLRRVKAA